MILQKTLQIFPNFPRREKGKKRVDYSFFWPRRSKFDSVQIRRVNSWSFHEWSLALWKMRRSEMPWIKYQSPMSRPIYTQRGSLPYGFCFLQPATFLSGQIVFFLRKSFETTFFSIGREKRNLRLFFSFYFCFFFLSS